MCPDGLYNCTTCFQLTDSFHGMHDVHKEQDKCITFGWNAMVATSTACQQQAFQLLLAKTTHSLPTVLLEVHSR